MKRLPGLPLMRIVFVLGICMGALTPVPVSRVHAAPNAATVSQVDPPTSQLIVKYRATADLRGPRAPASPSRLTELSAAAGIPLTYRRQMSGDAHVLRLPQRVSLAEAQRLAARLQALADVEFAEPDAILSPTLLPSDPQFTNQWDYNDTYGINAPAAWDITTGSTGIVIADIDTGITDHIDLSGRTVPGYDMISDSQVANDGNGRDADPHDPGDWITAAESASGYFAGCPATDSSWHGTHTAGTIGAASNNGIGVAGVNWVSRILPVRVLGKCGGASSDIVDGMMWAAGLSVPGVPANANPAKVLNMSLGGHFVCTPLYQNAINAITAAGATIVVAAGNNNSNASGYTPAGCSGVITIAATNRDGNRAPYSNYGAVVEISAPGGDESSLVSNGVLSTLNTGTTVPAADTYAYYQGTSMAAPHVTGVASLLLSLDPTLTPVQVQQLMQNNVTPFPPGSTCNTSICGTGIVNAGRAVSAPRISNASPSTVASGGPAFTLIVTGANFASGATVNWNGASRATTFVSGTQLQATILASDIAAPSVADITVTSPHPSYGNLYSADQVYIVTGTSESSVVYLPLIASSPTIAPGFWSTATGSHEFYVLAGSTAVKNHAVYISVSGCGTYKITHIVAEPIVNKSYSFSGAFYAYGTFASPTTATVSDGLNSFYIPGCGYVTGGPFVRDYAWLDGSQPAALPAYVVGPADVQRAPGRGNSSEAVQVK